KEKPSSVNLVRNSQSTSELLKKYLHNWKVNGLETSILKDTGSSDDLVSRKLVSQQHYTGEVAPATNALTSEVSEHSVAVITVETPYGELIMEALVSDALEDDFQVILGRASIAELESRG